MGFMAHKKDPAAVALGRKGGMKGGPARAATLSAEQRSESARKAVQARWAKAKEGGNGTILNRKDIGVKSPRQLRQEEMSEAAPTAPVLDTSKKALHLCLKRIKDAKDENELRRLTEELQQIVFHKQYQNAEN
jgi:hypothetical protein